MPQWVCCFVDANNIIVIDICLISCNKFYHINFPAKCLNKCLNGLKIYCIQTVLMKCPNENVAWWLKTIFLCENIVVLDLCLFSCKEFEELHVGNLEGGMQGIWKVACKEMENWHVFSYYVANGISAMFWLNLIQNLWEIKINFFSSVVEFNRDFEIPFP